MTHRRINENEQLAWVVVTRRNDDGDPKIEKIVDEKIHILRETAEARLAEITEEIGDYYEVCPIVITFPRRGSILFPVPLPRTF